MKSDRPTADLVPQLRALWKEAFGDTDAFLDLFFGTAYDSLRCRCTVSDGRVTAALYWLDFYLEEQRFAYIYAVATARDCRGQGLCAALMADTAAHLAAKGYHGALLVPQDEGLRAMYGRMGYRDMDCIDEFFCAAGSAPRTAKKITAPEYAALRQKLAPEGSLRPGLKALSFLASVARFYAGDGFLAVTGREPGHLRILEYLGDREKLPGFIASLKATEATVRAPGGNSPFAMYLPLTDSCKKPEYYPFAFD